MGLSIWSLGGAGVAHAAACPNEASRAGASAGLPECRAYEQVTPVSKSGARLTFSFSEDGGERVGAASIGVLAGATSNPDCPTTAFDLARGSGGWSISAIDDAPLDEFAYATAKCAKLLLAGNGDRLMLLRPASGSAYERDLYLQRADGQFEEIGPMLPPTIPSSPSGPGQQAGDTTYVDATPDLQHVFFTLQPFTEAERWPGDATILAPNNQFFNQSLYEYTGTGNTTPVLVGVDNAGSLISDCGTSPGGSQQGGNRLNAITEDKSGLSRVFFTAVGEGDPATPECTGASRLPAVDEIFARVAGSHTLALSEPNGLTPVQPDPGCTTSECQADISSTANFRDANYEGASANGERVFFSSPQQLLDGASQDPNPEDSAVPRNGEKGCTVTSGEGGCNLYEYDLAENPETEEPFGLRLLSGGDSSGQGPEVQGVAAVSEDGSHVFFVAKGVLSKAPNREGATAMASAENLYAQDTLTHEVAFIATLSSSNDSSQWSYNAESPMNATGDGRYLVFTSTNKLTSDDTTEMAQVFRYDTTTKTLVRISVGDEGYNDDGNTPAAPAQIERYGSESVEGIGAAGANLHPAISEDGSTVVFKSSDALTSKAFDNRCFFEEEHECYEYAQNIYEYHNGRVYLISGGGSAPMGLFEGAASVSPSGNDIFFESLQSLVPQDVDTLADIYDARADGGFVPPSSPSPCSGEGCQSSSGSPAGVGAPSSTAFAGPANQPVVETVPTGKPPKKPTRAQKLAAALKVCHKKANKSKRHACEVRARHLYGPLKHKAATKR
jgi:hypothetical protein